MFMRKCQQRVNACRVSKMFGKIDENWAATLSHASGSLRILRKHIFEGGGGCGHPCLMRPKRMPTSITDSHNHSLRLSSSNIQCAL
jgi:hypothetical protein